MTLLSSYHTLSSTQVRARAVGDSYGTYSITVAASVAWLGTRASNADLLERLFELATTTVGAAYSTWTLDNQGRLVVVASTALVIDFDHADTELGPEYFGWAPGTTGEQTLSSGTQSYALPYLWGGADEAAIHDEIPRRVQRTEQTTRRYKHPIVWDDYDDVELQYDLVEVARVKDWAKATPPGDWSTVEYWLRQTFGPPLLDWIYIESIPTELTPVAASVTPTPWGTYQLKEDHFTDVLGRSFREDDTPERWRVTIDGEDTPS